MHRSLVRRLTGLLLFALVAAPVAARAMTPAARSLVAHQQKTPARGVGPLGLIPVRGTASQTRTRATDASALSNKLEYHGGPVMRTSTTYVIYWQPTTCGIAPCSVAAGYNDGIDAYFTDSAADSGINTNVYSTLNQYYMIKRQQKTHVRYDQTFGGSFVDTTAFPSNGCNPVYGSSGVCISDGQVRKEIQQVMSDMGWTGGKRHAFFLALPNQVDTCYGSRACAFTEFCAYHSAFLSTDGKPVIYANTPYAGTNLAGCSAGTKTPNGDDLDATLNSASHEHREMTNDPFGNAWWDDQSRNEGSDLCAYRFGPTQRHGGPNDGHYNQVINGNDYLLQTEWSNRSLACKQSGS